MRLAICCTALALALAAPATAQLGAAPDSPPPDGLGETEGAPFPRGHHGALDALPDWGGIWFMQRGAGPAPAGPPPQPKLKGQYLADYQAWRAEVLANNGLTKRSSSNCSPPGMPVIMQTFQYPFEFLFTPGRVTVNQEAWMQTRTIWTDGRSHPEDPDPTYMGHSTGRWQGDVLVVDTVAVKDSLELVRGMGHSASLRITERIHLDPANPDVLINEMTLDDPLALDEPFVVKVQYGRDRHGTLLEFQCSENDRNPVNEDGETLFE